MNVVVPPKREDKGTSFMKLVSYVSQREDRPAGQDVLSDVPKPKRSESNKAVFDRLVDYIDRSEDDDAPVRVLEEFADGRQRVLMGDVACETNAFSLETAAAEMNMVAGQNRHVKDPVYHFIISWPESDTPSDAQIFESAAYSLKSLGLEGHQYVTAIHRDTDNVHAHIAVNRVHPVTFKAANMWNDVDTLQQAMRVLERHYGFTQDNGPWQMNEQNQLVRPGLRYPSAPQGAAKREVFSNKESLYHYAVEKARDKINEALRNEALSWKQLHVVLHANGLGLREQGDGLVIYDYLRPYNAVVKASSVHPSITKVRLEPVIGAYDGPPLFDSKDLDEGRLAVYSTYQPMYEARDRGARDARREERAVDRELLKARYQAYRATWEKPDLHVKERYRKIASHFQAVKGGVKRSYGDPLMRKLMYRVAEFEQMKAMAELRIALRQERQELRNLGMLRPLDYRTWVEQEALGGDEAAVSQLRGFAYRETRKRRALERQRDGIILAGPADDSAFYHTNTHTSRLYRDGTIEYLRDGIVGVVDHGERVEIRPGFADYDDSANYHLAVNLVSIKSGERGVVVGGEQFVERVLQTACDFNQTNSEHYEFTVTDRDQQGRYQAIERDYLHGEQDRPVEVRVPDNDEFHVPHDGPKPLP